MAANNKTFGDKLRLILLEPTTHSSYADECWGIPCGPCGLQRPIMSWRESYVPRFHVVADAMTWGWLSDAPACRTSQHDQVERN